VANILVLTPDVADYIADFGAVVSELRVALHGAGRATLRSGSLTYDIFSLGGLSGNSERLLGAPPGTWADVWVHCTSASEALTAAECLQVVSSALLLRD